MVKRPDEGAGALRLRETGFRSSPPAQRSFFIRLSLFQMAPPWTGYLRPSEGEFNLDDQTLME